MNAIHLYYLSRLSDQEGSYEDFKKMVISGFGTIASETFERSSRGRRLQRLIKSVEPDSTIVVLKLFNFGDPEIVLKMLPIIIANRIKLVCLQEQIIIDPNTPSANLLVRTLNEIMRCRNLLVGEQKKRSALISKWMGIHMGRRRIDSDVREKVISLLKEGHSCRKIAKLLNGKVSKTTVSEIKKDLR